MCSLYNTLIFSHLTCGSLALDRLKEAGFPVKFLPQVEKPGYIAGYLEKGYYGIPAGIPIGVALGDFQCSVLASFSRSTDAGQSDKRKTFCILHRTCAQLD